MVGVQRKLVVRHQVSRDGFSVVWSEQLRGCVPQLTRNVWIGCVKLVFEFGVSVSKKFVECWAIFDGVELERFARAENCRVLRKIPIVRVIKTVCITQSQNVSKSIIGSRHSPSINSRVSILTWRGRSRRFRSSFAVTVGYFRYSSSISLG